MFKPANKAVIDKAASQTHLREIFNNSTVYFVTKQLKHYTPFNKIHCWGSIHTVNNLAYMIISQQLQCHCYHSHQVSHLSNLMEMRQM
jgi:hypothetical protein